MLPRDQTMSLPLVRCPTCGAEQAPRAQCSACGAALSAYAEDDPRAEIPAWVVPLLALVGGALVLGALILVAIYLIQ